jgi:hypothetical protein
MPNRTGRPQDPKIIGWLLEEDNPSVRYFALRDLLGKPEGSSEVRKARREIMIRGSVPKILEKQNPDGSWAEPAKFYRNKYKGTVWQLIILAALGADGADPRIKAACEFIFRNSQDKESGGFSVDYSVTAGGGSHAWAIPCLTGNMVWSLIRLGCLGDERLRRAVACITKYQRFDDGEGERPKGWPYDRFEMCYGRHTCHMGAGKSLKALAEIPEAKRTPSISRMIDQGVKYFLAHHVYKKSHDTSKVSKPGWRKLGFPLMYQDDVLEILEIMAQLKVRDPRLDEAVELIESKRTSDGAWLLESTFNGRFQADIERKGRPSKWITLGALRALKFYRG